MLRRAAAGAPLVLAVSAALLASVAGLLWASQLGQASPAPTATLTPSTTASPSATITPTATATPTPAPDRQSCKEVRGTKYRSAGERNWFLLNCVTPTATRAPKSQVQSFRHAASSAESWSELVCSYDWDCSWALSVIACESGGNPNAYNPAGPYVGLFQILDPSRSLFDPAANIAAAYEKYQRQGPRAWRACA